MGIAAATPIIIEGRILSKWTAAAPFERGEA